MILTIHEFSHAWVAKKLGDPTAERAGRVSLNPLNHLDLIGTLMLFLVGIGWGKPVPVDTRNFEYPVRDEALTAFAGPFSNLALAVIAAIPYSYLSTGSPLHIFAGAILDLSLLLFMFNMLPFPPLDGSKFMRIFLPKAWQARYEIYLRKGFPYFLIFIALDIYIVPKIIGYSLVWATVSTLTYWLKTAILLVV